MAVRREQLLGHEQYRSPLLGIPLTQVELHTTTDDVVPEAGRFCRMTGLGMPTKCQQSHVGVAGTWLCLQNKVVSAVVHQVQKCHQED